VHTQARLTGEHGTAGAANSPKPNAHRVVKHWVHEPETLNTWALSRTPYALSLKP